MEDVLEKMKNPFAFKIGKYVVKTTFDYEEGCTIGDCVDALLVLQLTYLIKNSRNEILGLVN